MMSKMLGAAAILLAGVSTAQAQSMPSQPMQPSNQGQMQGQMQQGDTATPRRTAQRNNRRQLPEADRAYMGGGMVGYPSGTGPTGGQMGGGAGMAPGGGMGAGGSSPMPTR